MPSLTANALVHNRNVTRKARAAKAVRDAVHSSVRSRRAVFRGALVVDVQAVREGQASVAWITARVLQARHVKVIVAGLLLH